MGDVPGVTNPLAAGLASRGLRPCVLRPGSRTVAVDDGIEIALGSDAVLTDLPAALAQRYGQPVGGVVSLLGLLPSLRQASLPDEQLASQVSTGLFQILKACHEDLMQAATAGSPRLLNATGMDGAFGLLPGRNTALPIAAAATVGLMKAYRAEVPGSVTTCVDFSPELATTEIVEQLLDAFDHDSGAVEVGFTPGRRWHLKTELDFLPTNRVGSPQDQAASLARAGDVWLVTGGADGITAAIAKVLAARKCKLALIGRTPLPAAETVTAGLDEAALRKHFLEAMKAAGERPIPATIEARVKTVLKERRIGQHLAEFQSLGAEVVYCACDVRDSAAFSATIAEIYRHFGRIDGVIHGAGVIIDRRVSNKTPEHFRTVFETKVNSALTLAAALKPDEVKFMAYFSSTSARYGNRGQTDYSAANEFLNKLADKLAQEWPGRVVACNWGPWDSGMVSDDLRVAYKGLGIELIPPARGVSLFEDELAGDRAQPSEIVLSASIERIEALVADPTTAKVGGAAL